MDHKGRSAPAESSSTEVTGKSSTSQEEEASRVTGVVVVVGGYDQQVARSEVKASSSGTPDGP